MSGHSKWATIKSQKESTDKQRGKTFSKLSKLIAIAARDGSDPKSNFKLRLAVEKARQANMPKDNISRAIKKGSGEEEGVRFEEMTFEGYGPDGIGIIIETVSDNRNRTTSELKNILERGGGSMASPGSVAFLFKKLGFIKVEKAPKTGNIDDQILKIIDMGASDVEEMADVIEIKTQPEQLREVKDKVEVAGFVVRGAELIFEPSGPVIISDLGKAEKILKFMGAIEEHDDVQRVTANFDIPDELAAKMNVKAN